MDDARMYLELLAPSFRLTDPKWIESAFGITSYSLPLLLSLLFFTPTADHLFLQDWIPKTSQLQSMSYPLTKCLQKAFGVHSKTFGIIWNSSVLFGNLGIQLKTFGFIWNLLGFIRKPWDSFKNLGIHLITLGLIGKPKRVDFKVRKYFGLETNFQSAERIC